MERLAVFCPGMGLTQLTHPFCEAMARRFRENGYDTHIQTYSYSGSLQIQYYAKDLSKTIKEFKKYDHITVIGHSMGGLVARYAISKLKMDVGAYVSIGTPHHGCRGFWEPFVRWCASGDQMRIDSTFLHDLNYNNPLPTLPAMNIVSTRDMMVDGESQKWGGEIVERDCGHFSVMTSEQTFWEIWSWLTFTLESLDENLLFFEGQGKVI